MAGEAGVAELYYASGLRCFRALPPRFLNGPQEGWAD